MVAHATSGTPDAAMQQCSRNREHGQQRAACGEIMRIRKDHVRFGPHPLDGTDYTYFQTFVTVPAGTKVNDFKIAFSGMDDASRITIFNSANPGGKLVEGSYVTRAATGATSATKDLKALLVPGRNRIVVTQVDWCPVGNQLQSAQVQLNGSAVAAAPVAKPGKPGPFVPVSHGDVHIRTLDGLTYDFQATGDYVYLRSKDDSVIVQARQEAWDQNPKVSVNRAGAIRVLSDKIEWYMLPERALYVNGKLTPVPKSPMTLPGGGKIEVERSGAKDYIYVDWPNDSFTARLVAHANHTMDVEVRKFYEHSFQLEGLIGDMNGKPGNDMQIRGGANLGSATTNDDIARVGEGWRVRANETLFTCAPLSKATGVAKTQPGIADLDPAARQQANQDCKAAGVTDTTALRNCIYDVAATGDKTFIQSAQQFQQTIAALPASERASEKVEPVSVQVPAAAPAAKPAAAAGKSAGLLLPGEKLQRGSRYSMSGHYLTFQKDGNLCVYKSEGNQWVWCINNQQGVRFETATAAEMNADGRLRVTNAAGGVVWQAPTSNAQPRSGVFLTDKGTLEVRAPSGAVTWSSR